MANDALELEPECIAEEETRQLQEEKKDPPRPPRRHTARGLAEAFADHKLLKMFDNMDSTPKGFH